MTETSKEDINIAKKFYDVIVDIKSLTKIKEGFQIMYGDNDGKEKNDKLKKKDACIITAIGNSNKGKSYILSKISSINIPDGHSVKTLGLSIVFPEKLQDNDSPQKFVILDTEGSQNAITIGEKKRKEIEDENDTYNRLKIINDIVRDKQITENFLQNCVLKVAHIVIAVVGQITFQDQKFLNKTKNDCKGKNLFIIHNLMFLETKEEVKKHIETNIEKSVFFKIRKQNYIFFKDLNESENDTYYVENYDDPKESKFNIVHLIMAKEDSEAGKFYNHSSIEFLKSQIQAINRQKKYDIINNLKNFFMAYGENYFDHDSINSEPEDLFTKENLKVNEDKLYVETQKNLTLKKCYIDEIGTATYKGNIASPPYCYYKENGKFIILIELCGKFIQEKFKIDCHNTRIGTLIFKFFIHTEKNPNKSIFSSIEEGEFFLTFEVPLSEIMIKNKKFTKEYDSKNGILKVIYDINDVEEEEEHESDYDI